MLTYVQLLTRLKNDYRLLQQLPINPYMTWELVRGTDRISPTEYEITIYKKYETIKRGTARRIKLLMTLGDDYLEKGPNIRVANGYSIPYAPNWWPDGKLCKGSLWDRSMTLDRFLYRVMRVIIHDPSVTDAASPANVECRDHYYYRLSNGKYRALPSFVMTDNANFPLL